MMRRTTVPIHLLRQQQQRRTFAGSGGFQGPTSRGMGRDGGGRGPGGKHRTPRGGGGEGRGSGGPGGKLSAFQTRRNEALERDLDNARKATAAAASGGTGAGTGGFGNKRPDPRVHKQTNHPPHTTSAQEQYEQQQGGDDSRRRPSRAPHRGGPPKENFAESHLRPASEGRAPPRTGTSGIPKLSARKPKGHHFHDETLDSAARLQGERGGGRAAARGEMSNRVLGDMEREEEEESSGAGGLQAMMRKAAGAHTAGREGGVGAGRGRPTGGFVAPVRERQPYRGGRQQGRQSLKRYNRGGRNQRGSKGGYDSDDESQLGDIMQAEQLTNALTTHLATLSDNQDDDGYDSDADIAPVTSPDDPDYMDFENHEHVSKNSKGEYVYDWEAMDWEALMKLKDEGYYEQVQDPNAPGANRFRPPPDMMDDDEDPIARTFEYDYYFRDVCDVENPLLKKPSKPESRAMLPLKPHGPGLDDWLLAVTDHPSKYAVMERKVKHPDSMREPKPMFPSRVGGGHRRMLPGEEWVERYTGYLFVTGLAPRLDEETMEVLDFEAPMHKQGIAEVVAKMFGVTSLDVHPATPTSAFVGFATKLDAKKAMMDISADGSKLLEMDHSVELQKYAAADDEGNTPEPEKEFVATSTEGPGSILKVTGLPPSVTSSDLLQSMFPPGSRLEEMFNGPLPSERYLRTSPTTALLNLGSASLVARALKSDNITNNLVACAKMRPAQVLRAKRERIHDAWVGVNKRFGKSKLGSRLLVTGDVPPHKMYLSHNDTLHVEGLPLHTTLKDLASFFRPFSADSRDEYGSSHIVRCSRGMPTGSAYIGFELPGEMESVFEKYEDGKARINGVDVTLRPVKDKLIRRGVRETARPSRSAEELHADLYDWERHVDQKDIAELEELGIEKEVLHEVMITMRHHNRTFAAGDQAISGERLYQERQVGTHYRDAVRKYLNVLKSCVGTKDEPGLMYESMFSPEQDVDMGLFDMEEERIKKLRQKGM